MERFLLTQLHLGRYHRLARVIQRFLRSIMKRFYVQKLVHVWRIGDRIAEASGSRCDALNYETRRDAREVCSRLNQQP